MIIKGLVQNVDDKRKWSLNVMNKDSEMRGNNLTVFGSKLGGVFRVCWRSFRKVKEDTEDA